VIVIPMASQFLLERTDSIRPVVGLGIGYVLFSLVCMTTLLKRSPTGTEPDEPRPAPARTTADAS